jgi:hypothetical protein
LDLFCSGSADGETESPKALEHLRLLNGFMSDHLGHVFKLREDFEMKGLGFQLCCHHGSVRVSFDVPRVPSRIESTASRGGVAGNKVKLDGKEASLPIFQIRLRSPVLLKVLNFFD